MSCQSHLDLLTRFLVPPRTICCCLWQGLASPLVGAMMENAVLFFTYNQIQNTIRSLTQQSNYGAVGGGGGGADKEPAPLSLAQLALAGALSGTCVSFILTPVELIKCQVQVQELRAGTYKRMATGGDPMTGGSGGGGGGTSSASRRALAATVANATSPTTPTTAGSAKSPVSSRQHHHHFTAPSPAAVRASASRTGWPAAGTSSLFRQLISPLASTSSRLLFGSHQRNQSSTSSSPSSLNNKGVNAHSALPASPSPARKGSFAMLVSVIREQGWRGLYRGTAWTMVRETGGGAAYFGVYEGVCRLLLNQDQILANTSLAMARSFAPASGGGVGDGNGSHVGGAATSDATTTVGQHEHHHHQHYHYHQLEQEWIDDKRQLKPWQMVIAGGLAGVAFHATFFPADVIKSIYQTRTEAELKAALRGGGLSSSASSTTSTSTSTKKTSPLWRGLLTEIYRRDGIRGFYQGMGITMLRAVPSNAAIFLTYEMLVRKLEGM